MWIMIRILLIKKGKQGDRVNNLWGKGKGEMQLAPLLLTPKLRGRGPASPSTQVGELWKSLAHLMTQRLIPQWGLWWVDHYVQIITKHMISFVFLLDRSEFDIHNHNYLEASSLYEHCFWSFRIGEYNLPLFVVLMAIYCNSLETGL